MKDIIIINLLISKIKLVYIRTLSYQVTIKYVNYKNMDTSHSHNMMIL